MGFASLRTLGLYAACCCFLMAWNYNRLSAANESFEARHRLRHLVFIKTHKTGSTTVGNLLFNYAVARGVPLLNIGAHHLDRTALKSPRPFRTAVEEGRMIISLYHTIKLFPKDYPRILPDCQLMSIVREPISRHKSHYQFFAAPKNVTLAQYFKRRLPSRYDIKEWDRDNMCHNFRVTNQAQLDTFLNSTAPSIFWLVLERLDESLLAMKHSIHFPGLTLYDLVAPRNPHTACGNVGWDGERIPCIDESEWKPEYQDKLRHWNKLDLQLYAYANTALDQRIAEIPADVWQRELKELRRLSREVQAMCTQEPLRGTCVLRHMPDYVKPDAAQPHQPRVGYEQIIWAQSTQGEGMQSVTVSKEALQHYIRHVRQRQGVNPNTARDPL